MGPILKRRENPPDMIRWQQIGEAVEKIIYEAEGAPITIQEAVSIGGQKQYNVDSELYRHYAAAPTLTEALEAMLSIIRNDYNPFVYEPRTEPYCKSCGCQLDNTLYSHCTPCGKDKVGT